MHIQLCNPNHPKAPLYQPLRGYVDNIGKVDELRTGEELLNIMNWTTSMIGDGFNIITQVLLESGDVPLTSKSGLNFGVSAQLPSDQWYREVEHWLGSSLASL